MTPGIRRPTSRALLLFALLVGLAGITPSFAQLLAKPVVYGFEVLEKIPHPRENFIQGLQLRDGEMIIGTGLHGESRLRIYDFPSMELQREIELAPELFGEGVTRVGDRLYQLTWKAGKLLVYNANSLELVETASIDTDGWGLTHNGEQLIYSDGSASLHFLNTGDYSVERHLLVTIGGRPLPRLNELEYIDGEIWANVWQANQLVRVDPRSGVVTGIVDLRGLLDPAEREPDTDVLNGIAWDADARALWVTGKRWPWLYRLRIFAMPAA
ncbi:MAG: glutaminyl-peptide cyclotransferase [Pseudomonadota bacterium]